MQHFDNSLFAFSQNDHIDWGLIQHKVRHPSRMFSSKNHRLISINLFDLYNKTSRRRPLARKHVAQRDYICFSIDSADNLIKTKSTEINRPKLRVSSQCRTDSIDYLDMMPLRLYARRDIGHSQGRNNNIRCMIQRKGISRWVNQSNMHSCFGDLKSTQRIFPRSPASPPFQSPGGHARRDLVNSDHHFWARVSGECCYVNSARESAGK